MVGSGLHVVQSWRETFHIYASRAVGLDWTVMVFGTRMRMMTHQEGRYVGLLLRYM